MVRCRTIHDKITFYGKSKLFQNRTCTVNKLRFYLMFSCECGPFSCRLLLLITTERGNKQDDARSM